MKISPATSPHLPQTATCGRCHETKAADAFATRRVAGKLLLQAWCRECFRVYERDYREIRRARRRARAEQQKIVVALPPPPTVLHPEPWPRAEFLVAMRAMDRARRDPQDRLVEAGQGVE